MSFNSSNITSHLIYTDSLVQDSYQYNCWFLSCRVNEYVWYQLSLKSIRTRMEIHTYTYSLSYTSQPFLTTSLWTSFRSFGQPLCGIPLFLFFLNLIPNSNLRYLFPSISLRCVCAGYVTLNKENDDDVEGRKRDKSGTQTENQFTCKLFAC